MHIYNAYRLKRASDLWPVLRDARRQGEKNVIAAINKTYDIVAGNLDPKKGVLKRAIDREEKRPRRERKPMVALRDEAAHELVKRLYRIQSTDMRRRLINFDCSITVREHKGRYYLIAYADPLSQVARCLDFLKRDKRLEEYHYQNATDGPKNISRQAWAARGKVWHEMTRVGWDDFLSLTICDWDGYWKIDPWLSRAMKRRREMDPHKRKPGTMPRVSKGKE